MAENKQFGNSEQLDCSDCVNHGGDWDCDHVQCRKGADTINRQAVLMILKLNLSNGFRDYNGDWWDPTIDADAINEIKALPSAQPGWISCKKRLPNRDEYIKNNGLFIVSDGNRSYSEWYDFYDKRRFGEPTMSGFRVDYAVTHWMPLPEPYKENPDAD